MHVPARDRVLKFIAATITTLFCGLLLVLLFSTPSFSVELERWVDIGDYPVQVRWSEAVIHNDHIFVIGGKLADQSPTNAVKSAKINPNGSLESWVDQESLTDIRYLHAVAADANYVYVSGGWNSSASVGNEAYVDIWRARFEEDGQLGGWEKLRNLPKPIRIHESVIVNGYLYIIGGYNNSDRTLNTVYFAKIEEGGLGAWQESTDPLPHALRGHSAVVYGDFLYVTGGFDSTNATQSAVYMARFEANGDLSSWQQVATMRQPTNYHKALIHNDRLVIIGGTKRPEPAPEFSDVYSAPIAASGALGVWEDEPSLTQGMSRFSAVVTTRAEHEYIYTIGGEVTGNVVISTVFHSAPLGPPPLPPGLVMNMTSDPKGWVAPGEEITYTINFVNPGVHAINTVELTSLVPEDTELVADSITPGASDDLSFAGFQAGDQITWLFDEIDPKVANSVSYRVLRPLQPSSSSTLVEISKYGPATVEPGDLITYTLAITSTLAQDINNLVVKDQLPRRSTYVRGGTLGDNGYVRWDIPKLAAFGATTVEFVVTASHSLINSDYRVIFDNFPDAVGRNIVITLVGDTPLPPEGDGAVIINQGASATWFYTGTQDSANSNTMSNPSFSVYMPTVSR